MRAHERLGLGSLSDREWMLDAACRGLPPALFFPDAETTAAARQTRYDEARAVCAGCRVVEQCGRHAALWNESTGVWGGLGPRQRRTPAGEPRERAAHCAWCGRTFVVELPGGRGAAMPAHCSERCERAAWADERRQESLAAWGREQSRREGAG